MSKLKVTLKGKDYFYDKKQILLDNDVHEFIKEQVKEHDPRITFSNYLREKLGMK